MTSNHPYADWLNTYASPDFDAVGAWIRAWLDTHTVNHRPEEDAHLQEIFLLSTRYEWLFWEMAWRLRAVALMTHAAEHLYDHQANIPRALTIAGSDLEGWSRYTG